MPQGDKTYYTDTSEGLRPMNGMSETHPKQLTPEQGRPEKDYSTPGAKDTVCRDGKKIVDVHHKSGYSSSGGM